MSFDRNARIGWMKEEAKKRLLLLDGSWGVMIQGFKLGEADFRGARFGNHPSELKGNNDLLTLTKPEIIQDIGRQYLQADILDDLGLGQGQKVIIALQLRRVIAETGAAKILFAQLETLDHHAPGAIQQQQALLRLPLHPGDTGIAIRTHDNSLGTIPRMRQA